MPPRQGRRRKHQIRATSISLPEPEEASIASRRVVPELVVEICPLAAE